MSINYNNIVDLLELIYNFVYKSNQNIYNNYSYKRLIPENILLKDLIKDNNFEYQNIINSNLDFKQNFKLIDVFTSISGKKKILLKKYFLKYPITLLLQKHDDNIKDTTNLIDINYELLLNQIISEFIIKDKIPFYLLNICNFNINYEKISINPDFKDIINKHFNIIDETDIQSLFCISIYEHFQSYMTMKELFNQKLNDEDIANILFQVFFAHANLGLKLTNFRHNSFTIDSFLIVKLNVQQDYILQLGDLSFKLTNVKYLCKLFNYRNSYFGTFKNNYTIIIDNPTYDIYTFLKSLYDYTKSKQINHDIIKIIISNFITINIIDEKIMDENIFINKYSQSIIPSHILAKNNFFSSFINMDSKNHLKKLNYDLDKKLIGGVIQSITDSDKSSRMLAKKKK